ncbi:MAG: Histidinol-phosphate aminotransferase [uncultured bacterium]|nr:MAG: Histidinol-phosphate aminotransferase [uncultured bacterium]
MAASLFPKPKAHILKIKEYVAGKTSKDFGQKKHKTIKLSSNESLWGPCEEAINGIRRQAGHVNYYPETQSPELKALIASFKGVKPENIVLGNGSNEIIQFIINSYVSSSENIIVPEITFSMYQIYAEIFNAKVRIVPNGENFGIDINAIKKGITSRTKAIFIANPNNPTGKIINRMELELFLMGIEKNILVVIDEAYADFCEKELKPDLYKLVMSGKYPNLIILKTFSKAFGLAGLRLGYGIASEDIIRNLARVSQPFNINSLSSVAAIESLKKLTHYNKVVAQTIQGRKYIESVLREMDVEFIESKANFIMLYVKECKEFCETLGSKGVIVRDLCSFNLPGYVRVTISDNSHNKLFLKLLKEFMKK